MSAPEITFESGVRSLFGFGLAMAVIIAVFVPLDDRALEVSAGVWYL